MLRHFDLSQDVFLTHNSTIAVGVYRPRDLKPDVVKDFIASVEETGHIGLAAIYNKNSILAHLMVATNAQVLMLVNLRDHRTVKSRPKRPSGWQLLKDTILSNEYPKYAFHMVKLALALHHDHGLRISRGVDLLSLHPNRHSVDAFLEALGGKSYGEHISPDSARTLLQNLEEGQRLSIEGADRLLAMEAWAACHAASLPHVTNSTSACMISTDNFTDTVG